MTFWSAGQRLIDRGAEPEGMQVPALVMTRERITLSAEQVRALLDHLVGRVHLVLLVGVWGEESRLEQSPKRRNTTLDKSTFYPDNTITSGYNEALSDRVSYYMLHRFCWDQAYRFR